MNKNAHSSGKKYVTSSNNETKGLTRLEAGDSQMITALNISNSIFFK